ncbi:MAG: hypothetical protein ACOYU0_02110 [Nitrospirota bacterium]
MSSRKKIWFDIVLLLVSIILVFYFSNVNRPSVFPEGIVIPFENDSFYHLSRIIYTVRNYPFVYEFDPTIHAPEGSWLTWPKGYDFMMATIAKTLLSDYSRDSITRLLCNVGLLFALLNTILFLLILRETTNSIWIRILAMLIYALSPLTRLLHTVGRVDHHYVEHMFVLLSFLFILRWYKNMESLIWPLLSGFIIGMAQVFYTGLFVLQLPVLLSMTVRYLRNDFPPERHVFAFTALLMLSTIAISLNSGFIYTGEFKYYYLSWFHIYIAGLSTLYLMLLSKADKSVERKKIFLVVSGIMLLLLIPSIENIKEGFTFIKAGSDELAEIGENQNIFGFTRAGRFSFKEALTYYSGLHIFIPIVLFYAGTLLLRKDRILNLIGSHSFLYVILMNFQFRFHQYGFIFLVITTLLISYGVLGRLKLRAVKYSLYAIFTLTIAALQYFPLNDVTKRYSIGEGYWFVDIYNGLVDLSEYCRDDPGIVLADKDIGHYIVYLTNCSVISNNFNLTEFHWQKAREGNVFFSMGLEEFKKKNTYIKYIFLSRATGEGNLFRAIKRGTMSIEQFQKSWHSILRYRLLYSPPEDEYFKLLSTGSLVGGGVVLMEKGMKKEMQPAYRIYKITRQ